MTHFCNRFSVGLTGGIASGKSAVATRLGELGAAIVDTDAIAHALTAPNGAAMGAIRTQFGDHFVASDGSLDRAAMRSHVFTQAAERRKLEAILHPLVAEQTRVLGQSTAGAYVVFVVPLLVPLSAPLSVPTQSHAAIAWRNRVNRILVVDCDEATQLARLSARPGISLTQAQHIMAAQASRGQRLAVADDVIQNDLDLKHLHLLTHALHERYLKLAENSA